MLTALISRLMILAFGTLYPAYASYKAVRSKDVKEYVKWMMYWIVFALFTCAETFTDVLFSFWFPFYYEIKVGIVFWLLSPATKGSSFLYRHFVHPAFQKRESEIDEMLNKAKEKGYNTFLSIGTKGVTYATNVILQTAMKGGGGLMDHLRKSYSLTDLSPPKDSIDGDEDIVRITSPRTRRQMSSSTVNMRFQEFDVNMRQPVHLDEMIGDVRSTEDISSGYSSTDQLYTEGVMTRSSSLSSTRGRPRGRGTVRRAPVPEESEDSDNDQWIECTSNVEQAQVSTPQSIPSGANLDFMASLTSNTASNYQLNDSPSNDKPSDTLENNLIKVSLEAKEFIHELNIAVNEPEDVQKTSSQFSINSFGSDRSQDDRKGKYNKLQAPKPPKETEPETPPQTKVQETEPETSPQTEANINRPRAEMKFLKFLEFD